LAKIFAAVKQGNLLRFEHRISQLENQLASAYNNIKMLEGDQGKTW